MIQALKRNGILVLIYSLLVFSGGVMGFIMKKSTPSLIMGGFFGLMLLWSSVLLLTCRKLGLYLALTLMFLLEGFFSYRFIKTQGIFPAGAMLLLTSLFIIVFALQLSKGTKKHSP